jgi:hypothetical protein
MKNWKEGELIIDNRHSGGTLFEAATITCSHCQAQIIRNPARVRERTFCRKCNRYICDHCAGTGTGFTCTPFKQIIDEQLRKAARYV